MKKNLFLTPVVLSLLMLMTSINLFAGDNHEDQTTPVKKIFTKADIERIADAYVRNNLHKENPAFVDMENRGVFDMLVFNRGVVEYYKNTGTLEEPFFVLENPHYDKYEAPPILNTVMPMPVFFADTKGNGKLDIFGVKQLDFNEKTNKYNYRVLHAENSLLDFGTLITIILVLVIVLLIIAIAHR